MKKILVVDDNKTSAKIIQIMVKDEPYLVDLSFTPEEGLSRLSEESYDMALVDVYMPGMSGVELVRRFEETRDPSYRPKIVFVTADMKFNPAFEEGVSGIGALVVRKPVKPEVLLAALQG